MDASSCPHISFRFVPSRFLALPHGQPGPAPPGCRALPCGPGQPPTAAGNRVAGMSPLAGRGPHPCPPSEADSGVPAACGARPGCLASQRAHGRMLRRWPAARHRLDVPGAVGAGWRRSRAAGQSVLPSGPRGGRAPDREQHGAADHRPGPRLSARTAPDGRAPTACPRRGPAARGLQ